MAAEGGHSVSIYKCKKCVGVRANLPALCVCMVHAVCVYGGDTHLFFVLHRTWMGDYLVAGVIVSFPFFRSHISFFFPIASVSESMFSSHLVFVYN